MAWPRADEESKDSALKHKFEEGLSSPDMMQFLRLHARSDDFMQTVAKARRFAEAQEAARPKKSVRIVESRDRDHSAEGTRPAQPNFQPLIDGFGQVLQTILERNLIPTMASVDVRDEPRSKSSDGKYPVVPRNSRSDQQSPARGKNGRTERPESGGNTPERESHPNYGCGNDKQSGARDPRQSSSPGRWRGRDSSVSERGTILAVLVIALLCIFYSCIYSCMTHGNCCHST